MRFELIKLFRQLHVKSAFLAVVFFSAMLGMAGAGSFRSLVDADNHIYLKGRAAFENERRKYRAVPGNITIEKLNEALLYVQSGSDEWDAFVKGKETYPGVMYVLENAYAAPDGHFNLFEIMNADGLYERNKEQIRMRVRDGKMGFSENEIKKLLAWAEKVHTPYRNEMAQPWSRFYTSFQFAELLNLLTAMIYASCLYSSEKTHHMDLILGTLKPHIIRRIAFNKSKALICLVASQYLASMAAVCVIYFGISGPIAWKSQIQTLYFTSILPLSYQEVFLLSLITGLFACLAAAFFTSALNARLCRSMPAWILGIAVTFAPLLLRNFTMLPNGIMKVIQVLPGNAALIENTLNSLYLYPFTGNGMPEVYAIPIVAVLIFIAGSCCSVHLAGTYMCMEQGMAKTHFKEEPYAV